MCIVSNAEGLSENVLDGKTGWVIPKRQPKRLAEKILEVINLPEDLKQDISKNAMARVMETFNLELQQRKFVCFYGNSREN